jgi:hypothetical protein
LDLLCLQIRVRPVDIVDAEDDAADAMLLGSGRAGPAAAGRRLSTIFPLLKLFFFSAIFYVLCTNSSEGALKKRSRES